MTRTVAVFLLITPFYILVTYSEAWKPLKNWFPSGPMNTFSRSTSKPVFLSTKSYLSVLPNSDSSRPDKQFIPEPFDINEKTSVILHKVHSITDKDDDKIDAESRDDNVLSHEEYSEYFEDDINVEEDSQEINLEQNPEDNSIKLSIEEDSEEINSEENYLNHLNSDETYAEHFWTEENDTDLDSDEDSDLKY